MKYGSRRARFNWWVANLFGVRLHFFLCDLLDAQDRLFSRLCVHLWGHMDDDGEGQK